jgi:hypothetical protein
MRGKVDSLVGVSLRRALARIWGVTRKLGRSGSEWTCSGDETSGLGVWKVGLERLKGRNDCIRVGKAGWDGDDKGLMAGMATGLRTEKLRIPDRKGRSRKGKCTTEAMSSRPKIWRKWR